METIGEGADMTVDRRVTKVSGAALKGENRRSEEKTEEIKQNGFQTHVAISKYFSISWEFYEKFF